MSATTTLDRPYPPSSTGSRARTSSTRSTSTTRHSRPAPPPPPEGVDPRTFAKVVGVATHDGPHILVVLDATDQLDLHKARRALGAGDVRLLTEAELTALAPGCEVGAIPAVGSLFGLATYADYAVREDPEISFNAGSHRFSARVERAAWERACGVIYADFAVDGDTGPAWAHS